VSRRRALAEAVGRKTKEASSGNPRPWPVPDEQGEELERSRVLLQA